MAIGVTLAPFLGWLVARAYLQNTKQPPLIFAYPCICCNGGRTRRPDRTQPYALEFTPYLIIYILMIKSAPYPLDRNFGIPGPVGHGNRLPTCKYFAMQPQLCGGGLGAL